MKRDLGDLELGVVGRPSHEGRELKLGRVPATVARYVAPHTRGVN